MIPKPSKVIADFINSGQQVARLPLAIIPQSYRIAVGIWNKEHEDEKPIIMARQTDSQTGYYYLIRGE